MNYELSFLCFMISGSHHLVVNNEVVFWQDVAKVGLKPKSSTLHCQQVKKKITI